MQYQVSRNGQTYGPYTLEDLQRYVASGNVLPTDLAKSEEMADWLPVSMILTPPAAFADPAATGFSGPGFAAPAYTTPTDVAYAGGGAPVASTAYPDAPNLHWGLVVLFTVLTCGLFMPIWNLIISAWLRRVQPNANALFLYIAVVVLFFVNIAIGVAATAQMGLRARVVDPGHPFAAFGPYMGLRLGIWFVIWLVRLFARFSERASLEEHYNGPEPVGLQLNPVMTFFFGGVYFQSQLNRINMMKQAARYGAGRQF
jgi:hypothetical protein